MCVSARESRLVFGICTLALALLVGYAWIQFTANHLLCPVWRALAFDYKFLPLVLFSVSGVLIASWKIRSS